MKRENELSFNIGLPYTKGQNSRLPKTKVIKGKEHLSNTELLSTIFKKSI